MKRLLKMVRCYTAALLVGSSVLVSGAQAGPFSFLKPTPTTSPYRPQTAPPPLAPIPAGNQPRGPADHSAHCARRAHMADCGRPGSRRKGR